MVNEMRQIYDSISLLQTRAYTNESMYTRYYYDYMYVEVYVNLWIDVLEKFLNSAMFVIEYNDVRLRGLS